MLAAAGWSATLRPVAAHEADPCDGLVQWPLYVAAQPAEQLASLLRANRNLALDFLFNKPDERLVIPSPLLAEHDLDPPANELVIGGLGFEVQLNEENEPDEERTLVELTELVRRFDAEPRAVLEDVPESLQGIAGFTTLLFLQKLLPLPEPEQAMPQPIADKVLMGRIRDYTFLVDPDASDYGEGHLAVDVCTDVLEFVPLGEDRREFFHWDISVGKRDFIINERQAPSPIANPSAYATPFAGMEQVLPAFSRDPADPRSVWRRGLDHKLHSSGKRVQINDIYHRKLSEPALARFDNDHPWYTSTDSSCLDLFTQGRPPATFGELTANDYCLGRCQHPPIVNSGD
jgi:hypothetical protein